MRTAILSTRRAYRSNRRLRALESLACRRAKASSSLWPRTSTLSATVTEVWEVPARTKGRASARPCGGELILASQFYGELLEAKDPIPSDIQTRNPNGANHTTATRKLSRKK